MTSLAITHSEVRTLPVPAVLPALDGLRAISILLVMVSHSRLESIVPGVFGVTMFFFVSGFLITSLLIAEWQAQGRLAIGAFYARRMLRLYPPLLVMMAATLLVAWAQGLTVHALGMFGALGYLANYMGLFVPDLMANLGGQLWSLAVEEHFYLFYPLLMVLLLPRLRLAVPVLLAICMASLAIRYGVSIGAPEIAADYTGKATECRIDSILFGAIAAVLWWTPGGRALARPLVSWPVVTCAVLLLLVTLLYRDPLFRSTLRYTVQGVALMSIVLAVTVSGAIPTATKLLECPVMRWIGRHSYGLYLWHLLAFETMERLNPGTGAIYLLTAALGWSLSFALAALSYRYVERPFFALRKRLGSNVDRAQPEAAR